MSSTIDPEIVTSRDAPVFCMASMMLAVLSLATVVGPRPRGPRADTTAPASSTAAAISDGSITFAVTTLRRECASIDRRRGSRTTAVTS